MEKIYKTCSAKYTNEDIKKMSGVCTFVSYERLLTTPINWAIGKKPKETIVGMAMEYDGIRVYVETEE